MREMVEKYEIKLEQIKKDYQLADALACTSGELLVEVSKNDKIIWLDYLKI